MDRPRGIAGVKGRQPVGASVQVSRRRVPGGVPVDKDGFWILTEREDEGMRPNHPQFDFWNKLPPKDRQVLYGVIVHKTEEELFEWNRTAPIIRKPAHPRGRPHCTGDGITALRWSFEDPNDFLEIQCPNDRCEFAQGRNPACKPWMRFLFLVIWPQAKQSDPPSVLCKFTSRSWNTVLNFVGFFEYAHKTAQDMGLADYSFMGYPFSITHTQQTDRQRQTRYQVIKITPAKEPSEFFTLQHQRLKSMHPSGYTAITDESQQTDETVLRDIKHVSWGDPTE